MALNQKSSGSAQVHPVEPATLAALEQRLLVDLRKFADQAKRGASRTLLQREMDHLFQRLCAVLSAKAEGLRQQGDTAILAHLREHERLKRNIDAEIRALAKLPDFPMSRVTHVFDPVVIYVIALGAGLSPQSSPLTADDRAPTRALAKRSAKFAVNPKRSVCQTALAH